MDKGYEEKSSTEAYEESFSTEGRFSEKCHSCHVAKLAQLMIHNGLKTYSRRDLERFIKALAED